MENFLYTYASILSSFFYFYAKPTNTIPLLKFCLKKLNRTRSHGIFHSFLLGSKICGRGHSLGEWDAYDMSCHQMSLETPQLKDRWCMSSCDTFLRNVSEDYCQTSGGEVD